MTIVPIEAARFPAFSFRVEGSESSVLKIFIKYDGSDGKYGRKPLLIDEYWVIQSPSPCMGTLPPGLVLPEGPGFDWCFAPSGVPVGMIVLEEESDWCRRKLQLLIYCASHQDPRTLEMWEGCVLLRN
jgi:hypothetical protein